MRDTYHSAAFVLGFALTLAACSGSGETTGTTTSTATGGGGAGGAQGGGGEGGAFPCLAPFVTKGPWALAVDETRAKIRWEACDAAADPDVVITPESGGPDQTVTSTATSITLENTYTAPLNIHAPPDAAGTYHMHEAALEGLTPGACYTYTLGADAARKGRFCTARPSGEPLSFLAIGDTNPGLGNMEALLAATLPEKPEFTVHGGDIQYYDSGLETWASWFPVMQPLLSQGAFFPAIGNHESEKSDELAEYALRFFGGAGFDGGETFYRFQSGGVHFFSLNTEENIGQGSAQATWLEAKLAEVSAEPGYRFSVVFFHKPLVTCGDTGDNPEARAYLEPIFLANKVALVLQAHMHGYERFELGELTYLTTAGGGSVLGEIDENDERPYCVDRVASAAAHHAVIFRVDGDTLTGTAIDKKGAVIDAFSKPVP
jgi:acid phosphatase type 7